jgi:hypothetical protein
VPSGELPERLDADPTSAVDEREAVWQALSRLPRRFEATAVGVGLAAALVVVAAVVIPRVGAPTPTPVPPATQSATPGPQVTGSVTYDGIRMDTIGPATAHGTTPFTVTVTVTNTTTQEWRGAVDVGVHRPGPLPNAADNLFIPSPATAAGQVDIAMLPDGLTELDGVRSGVLVLAAGATTTVTLGMQRATTTVAHPDIRGWVPWEHGTPTTGLDLSSFPIVVVDPRDPEATCASLVLSTATEKRLPQQLLGAATTRTTSATETPTWTEVRGLPGSFAPSVFGADVDIVTLASGLGPFGVDGMGTAPSSAPGLGTTEYAGTWRSYAGIEPGDVTFSGDCVPVGGTGGPGLMAGVLHSYRLDERGVLDCAFVPRPKSLALEASAYCHAGSKAPRAFQSS